MQATAARVTKVPGKENARNKTSYVTYDKSLLFLTIFIVGIGLVLLYSTSSYYSGIRYGSSTFLFKKQFVFSAMGAIVMIVLSFIDYRLLIQPLRIFKLRIDLIFYVFCLFLQVLVLFVGEEIYGAKRWLEIPGIGSFQPSELTKLSVIMLVAASAHFAPKLVRRVPGYLFIMLIVAPAIILVAKEDLSTALVIAGIFTIMCFAAGNQWRCFLGTLAAGFAAVIAYIFLGDGFRSERIEGWLHIDGPLGSYQIKRGLYAIASGGLTGKGLGGSSMKLGFVPEAHNDMVFSIICEELGILGAMAIIFLYILLCWRILVVAVNAPDLYGRLLCVGVLCHVALQLIMNIAVVTNSVPATGIALPFISYGGTSLTLLMAEMGLVLSVSFRIEKREEQ